MAEVTLASAMFAHPAPSSPEAEPSYGTDDRSHREKLHALLSDGAWHTQREMQRAGGDRYGARVHEMRLDLFNVEVMQVGTGVYHWRLNGKLTEPLPRKRTWKERALAAELRVLELETLLGGHAP